MWIQLNKHLTGINIQVSVEWIGQLIDENQLIVFISVRIEKPKSNA